MGDGTWLCRTELDRRRLIDMERRLRPVRTGAFVVLAIALVAAAPWVGWWELAPLVCAAIAFRLADRGLERRRRPEYALAAAWVFAQAMVGVSIAVTGGPESPAVAWLVLPTVTLGARFSQRGVAAGVALTAVIMVVVTMAVDPGAVAERPHLVTFPLALLAAITLLLSALMHSDLAHRLDAERDPLTRLLNRKALRERFAELAAAARATGTPVGVVVADLDHFKDVNDRHGHGRGDDVLRGVADVLREALRFSDLVYRIGGEEFVILLPGSSLAGAELVADRVRRAVAEASPGGLAISLSCGVTSALGEQAELERLLAVADAALYESKRGGRNRVTARPVLATA